MILVDTNVWSELTKREPEPAVVAWLARNEPDLRLSVLVIAEVRRGCEMSKGQSIRPMLERWLAGLEARYADRTEVFDARDAHAFGHLAAQRTLGGRFLDIQFAAQALARDIPLATRNLRDLEWTGVSLINPWQD